jgi:osmotically-inducible protein OsmY
MAEQNNGWGNPFNPGQDQYNNRFNARESYRNRENTKSAEMYGGDFGRDDWEPGSNDETIQALNRSNDYNIGDAYAGNSSNPSQNTEGSRISRSVGSGTRGDVSFWFGYEGAEDKRTQNIQHAGDHRGKGPKGYQRSPERIREDVCDRLSEDEWLDASNIEVQIRNDEVILAGYVNSKEDRRRAEDLVASINGVRNIDNCIRIANSTSGQGREANTAERRR